MSVVITFDRSGRGSEVQYTAHVPGVDRQGVGADPLEAVCALANELGAQIVRAQDQCGVLIDEGSRDGAHIREQLRDLLNTTLR